VVMQEYVTAPHRELRVIVVGGRALAAAARMTRKGSGAPRLEQAALTPEVCELTERAARVCGLELCAVEVLEGKLAPRVFDVHACPALPELEALCSVDLAAAVIIRGEQLVAARAPIQPGP
jgi:ribosomal protein S6--L-glutamate ligase